VPDENEAIRQTNIDALKELGETAKQHDSKVELYSHLNVVYPGTPDFDKLVSEGVPEDIFEKFTKWEETDGREIRDLLSGSSFIHGAGGILKGIMDLGELKQGRPEIDKRKVREVSDYMDRIRSVKGISLKP